MLFANRTLCIRLVHGAPHTWTHSPIGYFSVYIYVHSWLQCSHPFRFDLICIETFKVVGIVICLDSYMYLFRVRWAPFGSNVRACVCVCVGGNYLMHWTRCCCWDTLCVVLGSVWQTSDRWHDDMSIFISIKLKVFFAVRQIFKLSVYIGHIVYSLIACDMLPHETWTI